VQPPEDLPRFVTSARCPSSSVRGDNPNCPRCTDFPSQLSFSAFASQGKRSLIAADIYNVTYIVDCANWALNFCADKYLAPFVGSVAPAAISPPTATCTVRDNRHGSNHRRVRFQRGRFPAPSRIAWITASASHDPQSSGGGSRNCNQADVCTRGFFERDANTSLATVEQISPVFSTPWPSERICGQSWWP
jgi:hypothetical protein